jgi:WD40 repeat protein
VTDNGALLLASASQDKTIRLWKISAVTDQSVLASSITKAIETDKETKSTSATTTAAAAGGSGGSEGEVFVSTTSFGQYGHVVRFGGHHLTVVLDALLAGHDDWVLHANALPSSVTIHVCSYEMT